MPPSSAVSSVHRMGAYTCSGNISEVAADGAAPDGIYGSRWIDLTRTAGSAGATRLSEAVSALVIPQLARTRPVGVKGQAALRGDLASILGGVLRAAFKGRPVSAQRRPGAMLWSHSPMGQRAFWARAEAMQRAGLIGIVKGVQHPAQAFDRRAFRGLPGRLWATDRLLNLAAGHGVAAETVGTDWPVSRAAETRRTVLAKDALVVLRNRDDSAADIPPDQRETAEAIREGVAALNERVRGADIRGCLAPLFRRSFGSDLRLGGRCYAIGAGTYQAMTPTERRALRIDGEATAEVDLHGALLSIFLALSGRTALPDDDLYGSVAGLTRAAVKSFVVQSFGAGRLMQRWSQRAAAEVRSVSPGAIRAALLTRYPELSDMQVVLPADLRARFVGSEADWCVGQYLVGIEAEVIAASVAQLMAAGQVVLPMHDAVVCKASAAPLARDVIARAFQDRLGVAPRIG